MTAAISTLKAGFNLKEDLLNYQYSFYKNAREESSKLKNKGIIFGDNKDRARTIHLAKFLTDMNEVYDLKKDIKHKGNLYKK